MTALRALTCDRPVLTLAELEAFEQGTANGRRERRFCCPLEACAAKPRTPAYRCLNVNVESGLWNCKRCGAAGKLRERWEPRPTGRAAARRAFALPPRPATGLRLGESVPKNPNNARGEHGLPLGGNDPQDPHNGAPLQPPRWLQRYEDAPRLEGSPGAAYLAGRGIPADLAAAAGVRYLPDWQHWEKRGGGWALVGTTARVLFPIRTSAGELVALHGRALEDDALGGPKLTRGEKGAGVFATVGALAAPCVAIVEGPCDALALAVCGVPAVALIGTSVPGWLPRALAFRDVFAATDADDSGDQAAAEIAARLGSFGARVQRWRPSAKDWNAALLEHGPEVLRSAFAGCLPFQAPPSDTEVIEPAAPERSEPADVSATSLGAARAQPRTTRSPVRTVPGAPTTA